MQGRKLLRSTRKAKTQTLLFLVALTTTDTAAWGPQVSNMALDQQGPGFEPNWGLCVDCVFLLCSCGLPQVLHQFPPTPMTDMFGLTLVM